MRELDHAFAEIPRIKNKWVFQRQPGAAIASEFKANHARFERMHTFIFGGHVKPDERPQRGLRAAEPYGRGATQDRLDVLGRVIGIPGDPIG